MSERNVQVRERRWGEEKFMWMEGFSVLLTAEEALKKSLLCEVSVKPKDTR
jgi:hypothetical protein